MRSRAHCRASDGHARTLCFSARESSRASLSGPSMSSVGADDVASARLARGHAAPVVDDQAVAVGLAIAVVDSALRGGDHEAEVLDGTGPKQRLPQCARPVGLVEGGRHAGRFRLPPKRVAGTARGSANRSTRSARAFPRACPRALPSRRAARSRTHDSPRARPAGPRRTGGSCRSAPRACRPRRTRRRHSPVATSPSTAIGCVPATTHS